MIFESIKTTSKDELHELLMIYIRLVEVMALRNNININTIYALDEDDLKELIDMGVISDNTEVELLKKILGNNYFRFISAISFARNNRDILGHELDKLNNKARREIQQQTIASNKPSFVDFFAGAGGLSCGFTQAGFKVIFANDFENVCVRTYRYNHPELSANMISCDDIRKIVDHIGDYIKSDVDVVIGGPPCQGFSSANQQRIIDDPRNELYKYYIKAISKILPKFVLMENVKGMLGVAEQVVEDYGNIKSFFKGKTYSYIVSYKILNSVDFSVAQNRERLIYIGIRDDIAEKNKITPDDLFNQIANNNIGKKHFNLADALDGLKPLDAPRIKNTNEIDDEKTGKKIDYNEYENKDNEYIKLINDNRKIPYLFNHKARYVNDVNYEIYRLLGQGDDASDPKIADIMPYKHRLHCFKDKYYKLIADRPSRTITAHLRMDCHSHIHPFQIRAITPREAARCQSFPDDYLFLGPYLKTYMQIGNAVPCLMAKGIAEVIKKYL